MTVDLADENVNLTYRGRPLSKNDRNIIYRLMEDQELTPGLFCFGRATQLLVGRGLRIGRTVGAARTVLRPDLATMPAVGEHVIGSATQPPRRTVG